MGDPLSVTTSVLAVAAFAAKSCECLYRSLRRLAEASEDIERHLAAVHALQSTFDDIARLENDDSVAGLLTLDFTTRLHACILDLQTIEGLARSFHAQLEEGKKHSRIWARIRLSLADRRQVLKDHLSRVESYHQSFLLDLLLLNIRLGLALRNENLTRDKSDHLPDATQPLAHHGLARRPSDRYSEHRSLQSSIWKHLESDFLHFCVWSGPIVTPRWHNCPNQDADGLRLDRGHGIAFASILHQLCPFRLELVISFLRNWNGASINFSLHWNVFWPRVVKYDARIVHLALHGDIDAMKEEFSRGVSSPSAVLPSGVTLLHLAASRGHLDLVTFLLQNGCRVNSMDNFGETPLHSAIELSKNYDVCRVLLEHGADLWNCNAEGKTPLHTFPTEVSKQILSRYEYVFDLSTRDNNGMTVLHYMAWSSKTSRENFKRYHERCHVSLETADVEGRSILHLAAQRGNLSVVEYLLGVPQGGNARQCDRRGRSVLHYAAESKRAPDTITTLVSHGADLQARDCYGRSVLQHAAKLGNVPALETLLALGMADELRASDHFGLNPLQIISSHSKQAVRAFGAELESRYPTTSTGVETDRSHGTLPAPLPVDTLPVTALSGCPHWIESSWQSLIQTLPHYRCGRIDLTIYCSMITCIFVAMYFWAFVSFFSQEVYYI